MSSAAALLAGGLLLDFWGGSRGSWAGGSRVKFPPRGGETIVTNQDAYGLRGCGASM